jgi:hypothetical protein
MASLFKTETPQGYSKDNRAGLADFLSPGSEGGGIDIVNNYTWTLTPQNETQKGRSETPFAILTEFRLLDAALVNATRYYVTGLVQQGNNAPGAQQIQDLIGQVPGGRAALDTALPSTENLGIDSPYRGLFDFKHPSGFWYKVPYFSDTNNEIQSSWMSLDIIEKIQNALPSDVANVVELGKNIGGMIYEANYPRVGVMDRPKLWESTTPRNINIKFPLFNTRSTDDIIKNWELCFLLTYQNSFNKRDFVTAIPPVFYTVYIPGQYFTVAAYVSNLQIRNRGNMRLIEIEGQTRNVPDVYEIDITLTDMVMQSQNMLSVLLKEKTIVVQNIDRT